MDAARVRCAKIEMGGLVRVKGFVGGGIFRVLGFSKECGSDKLGVIVELGGKRVAYPLDKCEPALPSAEWPT